MYVIQPEGFVNPKDAKAMLAPAILLRTGVSISELECAFWWDDKDFGFIQSLWETCISKEVGGSTIKFLMSICC